MARYLFLILALSANLFSKVYEDFDRAALLNVTSVELRVNGAKGSGKIYYSKFDGDTARLAFKSFMQNKGFYESGSSGGIVSFKNGSLNAKAIFSSREKGTAIIEVETEGEEKILENGDTPGVDLKDIPRPKTGRREFCLERLSGKEKSTTVIYEIKESVSSCVNYYKNIMGNYGWISAASEKNAEGTLLVFEADKKWCNIFIANDRVVVTVNCKR